MKTIYQLLIVAYALQLAVTTGLTAQDQEKYIMADDPLIQYTGRIDFANPKAPAYSFPGISIKASFTGTSVKAVIKDYGSGGNTTTNYYNVFIDGVVVKVLKVIATDTLYPLASGLANVQHTVELFKRTESTVGKSSFKGFVIDNTSLMPLPEKSSFKMEFIGDSWTCGYGNEISTNSPNTGFRSENEDNYRAWGSTLAKRFNAQYHCTAISGRGLYRNNTGTTSGVIPQEYNKILPGMANPLWNFSNYIPDLIVIHLGTNDWFQETLNPPVMLDSASYVNAYISFLNTLRGHYPDAKIICTFGNSKSDWWPENLKHLTRWRNYINATVKHFNDKGDNKIYKFELTVQDAPYGEDWHPTIATHNKMVTEITPFIESITGLTASSYLPSTGKITSAGGPEYEMARMQLYPNPVQDSFYIAGESLSDHTTWVLSDVNGVALRHGQGKYGTVNELNPGMYFLNVNGNIVKLIKK
ncbi:MAG: GDSL-type esterase/lipase family protein [Cytophagaceae bacterium]